MPKNTTQWRGPGLKPWTVQSRDKRTNHEATAPPHNNNSDSNDDDDDHNNNNNSNNNVNKLEYPQILIHKLMRSSTF